jgi:integrase
MSRLDRGAIERLEPGQSLTVGGLEIERRPGGDIRYLVNCQINGQRVHEVIGCQSQGWNRHRAQVEVERCKAAAQEGRLPRVKERRLTLAAAAPRYIARLKESNGKNIARKAQQLVQHLVPLLGATRLAELSRDAFEHYRKQRRDQYASDATINREMSVASHLLTIAAEAGWITTRCRVPKTVEAEAPKTVLSEDEQVALLRAAMDDRDAFIFIAFGLNTAMRHREILAARYDQVDWDNLRLQIPDAKAGARSQPITPELRDLLRQEQEMAEDGTGWIFPVVLAAHAKSGHRTVMSKPFARAVRIAGLGRHVTPHLMRHSAVTKLIKSGTDLKTVQKISGHKTLAMLLRYLHTSDPEIDRAAAILGQSLPRSYHLPPPAPDGSRRDGGQVLGFPKKKKRVADRG